VSWIRWEIGLLRDARQGIKQNLAEKRKERKRAKKPKKAKVLSFRPRKPS
jgi:hypothetical protein